MASLRNMLETAGVNILTRDESLPDAFKIIAPGKTRPSGYAVFPGMTDRPQLVPRIVCSCNNGIEDPVGTGNKQFTMTFKIHGPVDPKNFDEEKIDNEIARHNDNVESVLNILQVPDIAARLTQAVAGLFVFDPVEEIDENPGVEDMDFTDQLSFSIYACKGVTKV